MTSHNLCTTPHIHQISTICTYPPPLYLLTLTQLLCAIYVQMLATLSPGNIRVWGKWRIAAEAPHLRRIYIWIKCVLYGDVWSTHTNSSTASWSMSNVIFSALHGHHRSAPCYCNKRNKHNILLSANGIRSGYSWCMICASDFGFASNKLFNLMYRMFEYWKYK